MPFLILSLIIQVALIVHIIKTGRSTTWVFIVMFFPLVGSLAYAIVELLPELTSSRTAQQMKRNLAKTVNPDGDLRAASDRLAVADTVQNALVVAEQCLEKSRFDEAKALYERHLKGIHADDPALLTGLARAQFGLKEYDQVLATLDLLKQKRPEAKSPEAHLLYARSLEDLSRTKDAIEEYEVLAGYYPGPEATCRLGLLLKKNGDAADTARARELFQRVIDQGRIAGRHHNTLHREWIAIAQREAGA